MKDHYFSHLVAEVVSSCPCVFFIQLSAYSLSIWVLFVWGDYLKILSILSQRLFFKERALLRCDSHTTKFKEFLCNFETQNPVRVHTSRLVLLTLVPPSSSWPVPGPPHPTCAPSPFKETLCIERNQLSWRWIQILNSSDYFVMMSSTNLFLCVLFT